MVPTRLVDTLASLTGDVTLAGVARGDVLVRGATHWQNLARGTEGQVLRVTDIGAGVLEPRWQTPASGVTDHGALTGLADDDHPQYLKDTGDVITPSGVGVVGLRIDEPASYTAHALELRDSTAALLALISAAGQVRVRHNGLRVARQDVPDLESASSYATLAFSSANNVHFLSSASAALNIMAPNFVSSSAGATVAVDFATSTRMKLRVGHATNWIMEFGGSNAALFNVESWGGGVGVLGIGNAGTVPTSNPTGGCILYCEAGSLKVRGSSGTVTVLGAA